MQEFFFKAAFPGKLGSQNREKLLTLATSFFFLLFFFGTQTACADPAVLFPWGWGDALQGAVVDFRHPIIQRGSDAALLRPADRGLLRSSPPSSLRW